MDKVGEGTVEINGTEVTLPFEDNYLEGTSVELTAVPSEGWVFVEWKVDGETLSNSDIKVRNPYKKRDRRVLI